MPSLNPNLHKIFSTLNSIVLNKGDFEIILVLQRTSEEKVKKIRNEFKLITNLRVINDDGIGISRARNIAINSSVGDWILLLDDDVYINENILHNLTHELSNDELFYYGNVLETSTNNHYVPHYIVNKDLGLFSFNRVCSVALVINSKVFEMIGLFDENLGSGSEYGSSEESDLILRALLNKINIKYLCNYVVYHSKASHSLGKVEKYAMGAGALNRKYFFKFNFILFLKFLIDFIIRILFLCTFKKKRYVFFKGFFKGFIRFGGSS